MSETLERRPYLGYHSLRGRWHWTLIRGVLALLLGAVSFLFPFPTVFALTFAFSTFAFLDGIFSLITGLRAERRSDDARWPHFLRGLVGILISISFFAMPFVATEAYSSIALALIASWGIANGFLEISAAVRLRKELEGDWVFIGSGLISILFGIAVLAAMIAYRFTFVALAWMVGIYALAAGGALVMHALRLRWIDSLSAPDAQPGQIKPRHS